MPAFELLGGPQHLEVVEALPEGYVPNTTEEGNGITFAWWKEHEVGLLFEFDNGEQAEFRPVTRWAYREAHEGYHPAQYVVWVDNKPNMPEEVVSATHIIVLAERVLSIAVHVLNSLTHDHDSQRGE